MKDNQQEERRANWRKIIDEYLASNVTQKVFCQQHAVSLPQFIYYYTQFRKKDKPQTMLPGFVPVKIPNHENPHATNEIKLSLPNGFQCTFPIYTDAAQIKRLVEALLSC